jgi:hypothetical protein
MPDAVHEPVPSTPTPREILVSRALDQEVEWFYRTLGGRVPDSGAQRTRALVIAAALQSIASFHRGAISMCHTRKAWPQDVWDEFGRATSLVVRLECALHPSVGDTDVLEAAAVARLSALIADGDDDALARLRSRARKHYRLAIRALAKARARLAAGTDEAPVSGVVLATAAKESV